MRDLSGSLQWLSLIIAKAWSLRDSPEADALPGKVERGAVDDAGRLPSLLPPFFALPCAA
jgi:hypothetical protein